MINYPVYPIKRYKRKFEEDGIIYIDTTNNRFIFDVPSLEGDYFERREQIAAMDLPYKIFPLVGKCTNIAHIKVSKGNTFVDNSGRIFKYRATKRVPLQNVGVHNYSISETGKCVLHTDSGDIEAQHPYKYVQLFEHEDKLYIYNFSYAPSSKKYILL